LEEIARRARNRKHERFISSTSHVAAYSALNTKANTSVFRVSLLHTHGGYFYAHSMDTVHMLEDYSRPPMVELDFLYQVIVDNFRIFQRHLRVVYGR